MFLEENVHKSAFWKRIKRLEVEEEDENVEDDDEDDNKEEKLMDICAMMK